MRRCWWLLTVMVCLWPVPVQADGLRVVRWTALSLGATLDTHSTLTHRQREYRPPDVMLKRVVDSPGSVIAYRAVNTLATGWLLDRLADDSPKWATVLAVVIGGIQASAAAWLYSRGDR